MPRLLCSPLARLQVFQLALIALQDMLSKGADNRLKEQGLALASVCLSYDFVGTCLDDSSEEICTIQVPSSWRPVVEEPSTLQLLLDYYKTTTPPMSNVALECLVRVTRERSSCAHVHLPHAMASAL